MQRNSLWIVAAVYLVQIPILIGYGAGWIPIHPIVIMLPLVGLLNSRIEGRGREGLGLIIVQPGRSLLLALIFSALHFGGQLIVLRLEGISLRPSPLTPETMEGLFGDFVVDVFIIALWEEIVSRGYIQNRLQAAWGLWGVVVATLLFASLHFPSAFSNYGYDLPKVTFRFVQTGLAGFMLGYVYWRTGSVMPTIALHGLRNFAESISLRPSITTAAEMHVNQMPFQFIWLAGQVGLMLLVCRAVFGNRLYDKETGT